MTTKIEKFEDLEVWQNAISLNVDIYFKFQNCKDHSLKDQICKASSSIPPNIAEGFERQYNKEFIQYLFIAKDSAVEVRTQLLIAYRLGFISELDYQALLENTKRISAQLYNLIRNRKERFS